MSHVLSHVGADDWFALDITLIVVMGERPSNASPVRRHGLIVARQAVTGIAGGGHVLVIASGDSW